MEPSCHEAVPVRVNEIAGHIFAERHAGRTWQHEVHRPCSPERDLCESQDGTDLQTVARQEALSSQHAEGVHVIVALGLTPRAAVCALETLHKAVAALEECIVLWIKVALLLSHGVEALDLLHGPKQSTAKSREHTGEVIGHLTHIASEVRERDHLGLCAWPSLRERAGHVLDQVITVRFDEPPQRGDIEQRLPDTPILEQVRRHLIRQATPERLRDRRPLLLGTLGVPCVLVEAGDHGCMDMLGDHHLVRKVECWRIDPPCEQLHRIGEVRAIVRDRATVRDVHRHAVTAPARPARCQ